MADVKIRFAVNPDAETEKLGDIYVDNVDKVSNTSFAIDNDGKYQEQPTSAINGVEALSFATGTKYRDIYPNGYLVFNANGYLANEDTQSGVLTSEEEPQEFVWGATDSDGNYEVKISFRNAMNLDAVVFYGDKVANQFPIVAYLDNSVYPIYSDDARWAIKFSEPSAEHSIRFVQWHRPNYNAVLTKIAVMPTYVEIDKYSGLKSVESLLQSTGQPKEIFYGVVPSSGSVEVIDVGGEIADMVRDGVIPVSNMPVEILVNENSIQTHISQDSDYTLQSKLLSVQLSNIFERWNKLTYNGKKVKANSTLFEILCYNDDDENDNSAILKSLGYSTFEIDNMVSTKILVGNNGSYIQTTIADYLKEIYLPYGYLLKSSYRDAIDKVCNVAQLQVYLDDNQFIKFVSARPIEENISPIKLPKRSQQSPPDKELFVKNNFKSVFVSTSNLVSSFNTIETRSTQIYELPDGQYSSAIVNYKKILGSKAHNPNINVLGTEIRRDESLPTEYYMTIIKYDVNLPDEDILHDKEFMYDFAITYWTESNAEERTMTFNNKKANLYFSDLSDSEIIGDWVNFDSNGNIESIKKSAIDPYGDVVENIKIRVNNNKTITVYQLMYMYVTYSSGALAGVYNINSLTLKYKQYTQEVNDTDMEYDVEISNNELLQTNTKYNDVPISEIIKKNILNDYKNGILTANTSVACLNYYDTNGTLVKDWSKGEILQVGDIVQVDKDNNGTSAITYGSGEPMRFRITGRTFRKVGVPMLDLELQEVRLVQV